MVRQPCILLGSGAIFFDAAKAAGVRHVVVVSSSTVPFEPLLIGKWHLDLEARLEASGLGLDRRPSGNFASNVLNWASTIRGQATRLSGLRRREERPARFRATSRPWRSPRSRHRITRASATS